MPHPVITRWRQVALVLAAALALTTVIYLVLGWARRAGTAEAPALDPGRVLTGLLLASALGAWAVLGRARDDVSARVRDRHPERGLVLATDHLPGATTDGDTTAWSDDATPRLWRAGWRSLRTPALTATAALLLLGLTSLMVRMSATDLTTRGVQTTGQVTATGWTFTGLGWSPWIRVTHMDDGRTLSSTVHGVDPVGLPVGTQLPVVEDPQDPETVQAVDTANVSPAVEWWRSLLTVVLTASLVWLVVRAIGWWLWRRRLRQVAWTRWQLTSAAEGRGGIVRLVPATGGPVVLARPARRLADGEVAVVPGTADSLWQHRALLLTDGVSLVPARLPSTPAEHARWSRPTPPTRTAAGSHIDRPA